ncbi:nitrilase/cyanide hydratase and apolipoprotein N-acyltransferase [Oceanimonas sp. GK1]|uniref:carbon-nitrogen hydrolase family protein n=1 Tax=Oceanimonas sp. (strain GK1 / IBRC-M 10197) TaxID=511062 RepID=UPI0002494ABA|nr:carbon-nitrogen hydrolase family protein [Oceanimonas sp. GK1]AEY00580.1 nitrilase/cyanide hydratase and apolipoprotein N-acyltransferase [Oceanimonas sp. GK1]
MELVALQLNAGADWPANQERIEALLERLPATRPLLVQLPENAVVFGGREAVARVAEPLGEGIIQDWFADQAQRRGIWLVVGSMPTRIEGCDKLHTSCLVYDDQGRRVACYHKLHLFDVDVADGHGRYRESDSFSPGNELCVVDSPFGRLGLSICYDLRFPELYRALRERGADILMVPAAFTQVTGKAHWLPLLQARAIENQCYVLAAAQVGDHAGGRQTWGHSVILDPWGEICACLPKGEGLIVATLDNTRLDSVRRQMPVAQHARLRAVWRDNQ